MGMVGHLGSKLNSRIEHRAVPCFKAVVPVRMPICLFAGLLLMSHSGPVGGSQGHGAECNLAIRTVARIAPGSRYAAPSAYVGWFAVIQALFRRFSSRPFCSSFACFASSFWPELASRPNGAPSAATRGRSFRGARATQGRSYSG